jgi:predicted TIM-barrel enzyme
MWHWLGRVKEMGFSGVNNFPTHTIVDGHFRRVLEETGMSVEKEFEMVALAHRMDLFTIVYVATPEEAKRMADVGADAIIAHVGTTIGGSIGVTGAVVPMDDAVRRTQAIIEGARSTGRKDDAAHVNLNTDCVGFVGASSLERLGVEGPLVELTQRFKKIPAPAAKR